MNATAQPRLERVRQSLARIGVPAVVLGGAMGWFWPPALLPAYRFALFACLAPAIGSLLFALIHRCTGGNWGGPLQPFLLLGSRWAPWIWLFVFPLLLFVPRAAAGAGMYDSRAMLALRAALYAAILFAVAFALVRRRAAWVGPAGLLALVFSLHVLDDDWLAGLEPGWNSTAFALIWLTGQAVAGLSAAVLGALCLGILPESSGRSTERPLGLDWGNLLLTAALLWCYVLFAQFLIIWAGNLPRETAWFIRRTQGPWLVVPLVLAALNFAVPLVLLLSRRQKRTARGLAFAAGSLLLGQIVYVAWMILPAFPAGHTWTGVATACFFAGGCLALGLRGVLARIGRNPNPP